MVCRSRVQPSLFGEERRSDTNERWKSNLRSGTSSSTTSWMNMIERCGNVDEVYCGDLLKRVSLLITLYTRETSTQAASITGFFTEKTAAAVKCTCMSAVTKYSYIRILLISSLVFSTYTFNCKFIDSNGSIMYHA